MKKFFMLSFLLLLVIPVAVQATMFRVLDAKAMKLVGNQYGAMGFKGKVLKIEDVNGEKKVTFQVQDVLTGDLKAGQNLVLTFPDPKNPKQMGYIRRLDIAQPVLREGDTSVLFVSTNMFGKNFLLGGANQGQFFVTKQNGKDYIYNRLNNQNILSAPKANLNPLMNKIVSGMYQRNSGTLDYDDFKQLMNQ